MSRLLQSNNSFYSFTLITLVVSALVSCGKHSGKPNKPFTSTEKISAERELTTDERAIATRICYAYQSKGTSFRTSDYLGSTFNFSINTKNCAGAPATYNVSSVLQVDAGNLIFKTTSTQTFQSKVQTNDSGYLSQLCTKIQNNQAINNTVTDNGFKVQVKFAKDVNDNTDNFTIQYYPISANGAISSAETIKVRTQFNITSNQILGMDETYQKYDVCPNGGATPAFTEFIQKFTSFNK